MVAQKSSDKTFFVGVTTKLVIGFTLVFTIIFGLSYYWFYTFTSDVALTRVQDDLRDTLVGLVAGVDVEPLKGLIAEGEVREDGYTDDQRYWDHVQWLYAVNSIEPRAYTYSFVPGKTEDEIIYVGSFGALWEEPAGRTFLYSCVVGQAGCNIEGNLRAIQTRAPYYENEIYQDEFSKTYGGGWISGYAPVFDDAGELVIVVGVDFRADYVLEVQRNIIDNVAFAFLVTYSALFLLVFIVARRFARPIRRLTEAAEEIGHGNYGYDFSPLMKAHVKDEISILSGVFADMAGKVYQREETLKRQVQELRIEIDEAKACRQVREIVESDAFEDIRAKAKAMRERRRQVEARTKRKSQD